MSDREDLDLYKAGGPAPSSVAVWVARTLGVLAGLAVGFYGAALWLLRCFDTCPSDPAVDKTGRLLSASVILAGLVIVVAAASLGTSWKTVGARIVVVLGSLVALCGIATLALAPGIDFRSDRASTRTFGVIALAAGAAVAGIAYHRARAKPR